MLLVMLAMLIFSLAACVPTGNGTVDKVTLSLTSKTLNIGENVTLTATVTVLVEGTDESVTWVSSKTDIASVDNNGKVTAIAAGKATVTATSVADTTKMASAEITVVDPNAPVVYKTAGTYKVGTDIEAGEYLLITDKQDDGILSTAYYQVTATASAAVTSDDFLYNGNFYYRTYVRLESGQYLQFNSAKLYKLNNYPAVNKNAASWHSGQYKVGTDLDAGEYKLTVLEDNGFFQITRTPNAKIGTADYIDNDFFSGQQYVTLTAGDYLEFKGATLTKVA